MRNIVKNTAEDYGSRQEFLKVRSFKMCTGHAEEGMEIKQWYWAEFY